VLLTTKLSLIQPLEAGTELPSRPLARCSAAPAGPAPEAGHEPLSRHDGPLAAGGRRVAAPGRVPASDLACRVANGFTDTAQQRIDQIFFTISAVLKSLQHPCKGSTRPA
jgi:hypothetical protein